MSNSCQSRGKTTSSFTANLQANIALRRIRVLIPVIAVLLCSACGKSPKPVAASAVTSASASEGPAFKIAEEQRKALEQAKQLEQDLQTAADKQRRAIEEATDANK